MMPLRSRSHRSLRARWLVGGATKPEQRTPSPNRGPTAEPEWVSRERQLDVIAALRREPALRRAWLLPRDAALELAVEAMPGTDLAVGARITRMLQNRLGDAWEGRALRVVFLSGAAIVARRTGGVPPIYASGIAGEGEQPGEDAPRTEG